MENPQDSQIVVDLEVFRGQKIAEASFAPLLDLPEDRHEVQRRRIAVRTAGMIGRMVITEPRDTAIHQESPAIIIEHGYMASEPAYNRYASELASLGFRVAHGAMPRSSSPWRHYHPKNLRDALRAHSQMLNGFSKEMVRQYPDSPEQHYFVGHSLGGLAVSKFISYRPEAADSAVLLASAGLKPHSFLQMANRAGQAVRQEIVPFVRNAPQEDRLELAVHSLRHMLRNPLFTLREGYHAATGDAVSGIRAARAKGVKVGALWLTHDTFFPLHEVDEPIKAEFDHWRITFGNHLAPQEDMRLIAEETVQLLHAMRVTRQAVSHAEA